MLGDEARSLLGVFLLGELAESRCYYEIARVHFEKQWAPVLWLLSRVSLAAVTPKPTLGGPGRWPPLPCSGLGGHSVVSPTLARGDPSSLQSAPVGCGSAGGTLSGSAWRQ